MTRRVPMPAGEPDGRATPRLERIVRAFRAAGINAKAEPQMDALRSPAAAHSGLNNATPAVEAAELERTAEQMRAYATAR